jgi:TolB-like protein
MGISTLAGHLQGDVSLSEPSAAQTGAARPSVFLSYASEDRQAARALREALTVQGLDVWYDESELGGGEAWDQKIRRQIRECDYFLPVVSAQTEARREGYFRREWRLAVERTLDMADDHLFLLPMVIDATDQSTARVPEKFLSVQWLKVPGGQANPALEALCRRLTSGNLEDSQAGRKPPRTKLARAPVGAPANAPAAAAPPVPAFPRQEPGQRGRFYFEVLLWAARMGRARFKRLPRWMRIVASIWICIYALQQCHSTSHDSPDLTPAQARKLKSISEEYHGDLTKSDLVKLGKEVALQFSDDSTPAAEHSPLLAIAFTAPAGDAAAEQLANTTFAMTYGMIEIAHHGQVALSKESLVSRDLAAAVARGKANDSRYVLTGNVAAGNPQFFTIRIAAVADGSVVWTNSYAVAGADAAKIASEAAAHIPPLGSN